MLVQTNKKGFKKKKISLKHMASEMSSRGNVLVGKCPVWEVSFGEVSGRGIVRSGKCPSGKYQFGEVSVGELASRGTVRIPFKSPM